MTVGHVADFNSDNLLTADAAIIFSLQKGFPENAVWRIIDTSTVGAQTASAVGDNILQISIAISEWLHLQRCRSTRFWIGSVTIVIASPVSGSGRSL